MCETNSLLHANLVSSFPLTCVMQSSLGLFPSLIWKQLPMLELEITWPYQTCSELIGSWPYSHSLQINGPLASIWFLIRNYVLKLLIDQYHSIVMGNIDQCYQWYLAWLLSYFNDLHSLTPVDWISRWTWSK